VLQGLGVRPGDRVATIAPNTHAQLESCYAVPQLGAVLVPVNYRPAPDDFVSIVNHSGSTARPKGVMITRRNAAMNTIGTRP
jgi:fatty-acyl-CoA synthase